MVESSKQFLPTYMLFGIGGLLGNAVYARLCEKTTDYRIFSFDHIRADITNREHIEPLFAYVRPTVVINCAAINDVEICEQAKEGAFRVNFIGPQILAEECDKYHAKLVHVSAATVFDGKHCHPYSERSRTDPLTIHGKSKLEGEKAIMDAMGNYLIIRPGWCFHSDGNNPITDWISRVERGLNVPVMTDCHVSPTYVPDLIDAVFELLDRDAKGIFHVANADAATCMSFAETMAGLAKLNANLTNIKLPFAFPKYMVLSTKKYSLTTSGRLRPWGDALRQCLFNMHRYKPREDSK